MIINYLDTDLIDNQSLFYVWLLKPDENSNDRIAKPPFKLSIIANPYVSFFTTLLKELHHGDGQTVNVMLEATL